MNLGTPTQPASGLRTLEHSSLRRPPPTHLIWKAIGVAAICAVAAFLLFLVDRSLKYRRSFSEADTVAEGKPVSRPAQNPTAPLTRAPASSTTEVPVVVPDRTAQPHDTEFILSPTTEFQHLGSVSIRLKAVHPARDTCDFVLKISNGREWNQLELKVNQPVPLVKGSRSTQLVVSRIFENSVSAHIDSVSAGRRKG